MPLISYVERRFSPGSLAVIEQANEIIDEYAAQGFDLTLRQLYYQFVSRDLLANRQREYKRLGSIVNDARLAGLIDWERIVDRTRELKKNNHWESPAEIVQACAKQFRIDRWATQPVRPEVWIEKDALIGVIEGVCRELDVSYFSCRGYTSQSEMWTAAQRLIEYTVEGQTPIIIHLGDHDPSGLDMTNDIERRMTLFFEHEGWDPPEVRRIALNMDQVEEYGPPPNPAKITDSRAEACINKHGTESWELDALEPGVMADLIRHEVLGVRDEDLWEEKDEEESRGRKRLAASAAQLRKEAG